MTVAATRAPGEVLRKLMARRDRVLAVLHPPTAAHARIMQEAGCEAGFVGTGGVVGGYTGLADVGSLTMMECITVAGWIARSVDFPVIMDGDTGHGGVMAVRRMVRECIRAGLAGVRIDDQPIEGKRRTQIAGLEVVPLEQAVARYRAAVDMKDEIEPSFVVMAQCYARDAAAGGLEESLVRLQAYEQEAGVDWVQLASPHSIDEIRRARDVVAGPFSFMRGHLPRFLSAKEHLDLGINLAWYPSFTHHVMFAALWDFLQAFRDKDVGAWEDFLASRKNRPYPMPGVGPEGDGPEKQQALEERYFSAQGRGKYRRSPAGSQGAT